MEVQSAIAFDTEELERLKASNLMKDFVRAQDGNWNHAEWENFVGTVRELGYSLPIDVIGAELEMEKSFYWKVKNGELMVPESQDSSQATPSACEAMVCERADELQKGTPYDVHGPRGPDMPTKRNEPFDPISELENAVIVEGKNAAAEVKGEPEENEPELSVGSGAWENVNFDSLTKEERAVYLKDQWKKKMGEG